MEISITDFLSLMPWWSKIVLATALSALITYFSIPTILTVSHKLGLYERKNGRGSHKGEIPTLGGVAIFASLVVSGAIFADKTVLHEFQFILGGMAILFFVGIKDDLLVLDPKKKLVAQLIAAGLVVVLGNVRITSFHGFANIEEVPYIISVIFSIFVYIVIINGFNLIDGIDGLSAGVAILVSITFGVWFLLAGQIAFGLLPFSLVGALGAFFRYNVFSKTKKIFLGDTGSLTIGMIVAVIAIKFLEFDHLNAGPLAITSAPAVAFGILIVPLFDTLRVFTLRIFGGESPFHADRKHIHHRLLDLGCSHLKATLIINGINVFFIGLVFLLQGIGNLKLLIVLLPLATLFSYIPVYLLQQRNSAEAVKERRRIFARNHSPIDISAVYPD